MEKQKRNPIPELPLYVTHFGSLNHQATINSIEAYVANGVNKRTVVAWLLNDHIYMNELLQGYPSDQRQRQINEALTDVARDLWNADEMQRYKDKRVVIGLPLKAEQETA